MLRDNRPLLAAWLLCLWPRRFLVVLLASLTACLASWAVPFQDPAAGLDPSWAQALVEATDHGRRFGHEIVFSYGPLHQALTAQIGTALGPLLLARLLFSAIWFAVQLIIGGMIGLASEACICLAVLIAAGAHPDLSFYLLALLGILTPAVLRLRFRPRRPAAERLLCGLLASGVLLATLAKLSFAAAAVPPLLLLFGLQIQQVRVERSWRSSRDLMLLILLPLGLLAVVGASLSGGSLIALGGYYFGLNVEIVRGYADAMSYPPSWDAIRLIGFYAISCLVSLALLTWLVWRPAARGGMGRVAPASWPLWTMLCWLLLAWVVFKASFVRDDSGHTSIAIQWSLCSLVVLIGFCASSSLQPLQRIHRAALAVSLLSFALLINGLMLISGLSLSVQGVAHHGRGFLEAFQLLTPTGWARLAQRRARVLASLRPDVEDFGIPRGSTADVIPWEITPLLVNQLSYTPRPVPQSYSAYTTSLQAANRDFISDPDRAPEWMIVSVEDIDGRLPIGLDSPALLALADRYVYSHRGSRGSLVFRQRHRRSLASGSARRSCRRLSAGPLQWQLSGRRRHHWITQPLPMPPPGPGLVVLNTQMRDSRSRALQALLYRPFPVFIEYLSASGEVLHSYRLIPGAGLERIVSPLITDTDALLQALAPSARAPEGQTPVHALRLSTLGYGSPFSETSYSLSWACGRGPGG